MAASDDLNALGNVAGTADPNNPYNFTAPPEGSFNTQAYVNWINTETGETWGANTGGWTPPSDDWVAGNVINDWLSQNPYADSNQITDAIEYYNDVTGTQLSPEQIKQVSGKDITTLMGGNQADPTPAAQPGLGQLDIGTFTAPTVTQTKPTLTTDPTSAIFSDASPGYNLTSYGIDPNATSSLYADQLARDTGARGLRPEEIQQVVGGAYQNVLGREAAPEGYKYWASQLGSGQLTVPEFQKAFIEAATANQENIAQTPEGAYAFTQLPSYGPVYTSGAFQRDLGGLNTAAKEAAAQMDQYGFETGTAGDWAGFKTDYDTSKIPEDFNWQQYVSNYSDLLDANIDTAEEAMQHYLKYGQGEGRHYLAPEAPEASVASVAPEALASFIPSDFDWQQYIANYPDLSAANIDTKEEAIQHYLTHGKNERRKYLAPVTKADGGPVSSMEYFLAKNGYGGFAEGGEVFEGSGRFSKLAAKVAEKAGLDTDKLTGMFASKKTAEPSPRPSEVFGSGRFASLAGKAVEQAGLDSSKLTGMFAPKKTAEPSPLSPNQGMFNMLPPEIKQRIANQVGVDVSKLDGVSLFTLQDRLNELKKQKETEDFLAKNRYGV